MDRPDILNQILKKRAERLAQEKIAKPLEELIALSITMLNPPSFSKVVADAGLTIIGEVKKASPSKGIIRDAFDPISLARQYASYVDALSVLTEQDFFKGHPDYLAGIARITTLPILRKDFLTDPYQVYEARVLGASCILLIAAVLTDGLLQELHGLARSLSMDALVEVHDEVELDRALTIGAKLIGVNNRNLKTFEVDLNTTRRLSQLVPNDVLLISESGFRNGNDVEIAGKRINGILVGETFMRAASMDQKAREFKEAYDA